jgi:hypothetical protein
MDPAVIQTLLFLFIGAMALVAFEMRASLRAPSCPECPHCRAVIAAEQRQQADMQKAFARRERDRDRDDRP